MAEVWGCVMELLTHSRLATFRTCPRKHQLRYEVGLVPDQDERAMRVGTAYHAAHEAYDLGRDIEAAIKEAGPIDPYDAAMVAAMFTVSREIYADQEAEVIATELEFEIPLVNPDTGAESRVWRLAGKIDRLYRLPNGRLALKDRKTTTEDLSPGSDLWLRLRLDIQASIYVIAARHLGYDVGAIIYDVAARPMFRPQMATPVADRKYTQKESKLADGTVRPAGSLYANQRESDETPEEFAARVADALRAEPSRFFARHEVSRLDADLGDAQADLWTQQMALRYAQRSGRWFRNPSACVSWSRCPYLSICGDRIARDLTQAPPAGFRWLEQVHQELTPPVGGKPDHATVAG